MRTAGMTLVPWTRRIRRECFPETDRCWFEQECRWIRCADWGESPTENGLSLLRWKPNRARHWTQARRDMSTTRDARRMWAEDAPICAMSHRDKGRNWRCVHSCRDGQPCEWKTPRPPIRNQRASWRCRCRAHCWTTRSRFALRLESRPASHDGRRFSKRVISRRSTPSAGCSIPGAAMDWRRTAASRRRVSRLEDWTRRQPCRRARAHTDRCCENLPSDTREARWSSSPSAMWAWAFHHRPTTWHSHRYGEPRRAICGLHPGQSLSSRRGAL